MLYEFCDIHIYYYYFEVNQNGKTNNMTNVPTVDAFVWKLMLSGLSIQIAFTYVGMTQNYSMQTRKHVTSVVRALASSARGPRFDPADGGENFSVRTHFPYCHLQGWR